MESNESKEVLNKNHENEYKWDFDVLFATVSLPSEFSPIRLVILRSLGDEITVKELIDLSEQKVLKLPEVGHVKAQQIIKLQSELKSGVFLDKQKIINYENDAQLFVNLDLPSELGNLRKILVSILGETATIEDVLSLTPDYLTKIPGVGRKKVHEILSFKEELLANQYGCFSEEEDFGLDSIFLSEIFARIPLPAEYEVVGKALIRCLTNDITVKGILQLSEYDLSQLSGIGQTKVILIKEIQEKLKNGELTAHPAIEATNLTEASLNKIFSHLVLPTEFTVSQKLLVSEFGDDATIQLIIELEVSALKKLPNVGKKKLENIVELQAKLSKGEFLDQLDGAVGAALDADEDIEPISLIDIEDALISDMDSYIDNLSDKDSFIFMCRHGIDCEHKTLEEVGEFLPGGAVTRERIRQLQKRVDTNWPFRMSISSKQLWLSIQDSLSLLRDPIFTKWKSRFSHEQYFFEFLEISCSIKPNQIKKIIKPTIKNDYLVDFWLRNKSPENIDEVVDYIEQKSGSERAVAENILIMLQKSGMVKIQESLVSPLKLSTTNSVAHSMLLTRECISWEEIQGNININEFGNNDMPSHRMDGGISRAVDAGYIYQCGRGRYKHASYLDIDDLRINEILLDLKSSLEAEKLKGRNAINLMADFYHHSSTTYEYFVIRHIVRSYGERASIFFKGKSGADTVSLDTEFSSVSQEKAIVAFMKGKKGTVTRNDIASVIRSQSIGHAAYYLDMLMESRQVVRVGESEYDLVERAFNKVGVKAIILEAAKVIETDTRMIEADVLRKKINRSLELHHNKQFYQSLIFIHAEEHGYHWNHCHNLISKEKIEFEGLADLVRQLIKEGYVENEQLINALDRYILITPLLIKNVIQAVKYDLQKTNGLLNDSSQSSGGITDYSDEIKKKRTSYTLTKVQQTFIVKLEPVLQSLIRQKLEQLGIFKDHTVDAQMMGDQLYIDGQFFDKTIVEQRLEIVAYIENDGYLEFLKREALSWFNRFCAIRFMELNDYLEHSLRVLSHPTKNDSFEIIERCTEVVDELGLDRSKIIDLKLAADGDAELYESLLIAQCATLSADLPFLFNEIDHYSNLLVPDNLTRTDSFLKSFIELFPDDCWNELSIISSLYGGYREKGHKAISKDLKINTLPLAVEPRFTPSVSNLMVENALARLWLLSNPESNIANETENYIERAQQTDAVNAELNQIISDDIQPEQIKFLDPCCGSGVTLLEAYRVLLLIYKERGYRNRDIPQAIIENNLFALSANIHASQVSQFVLMMTARADDHRVFNRNVKPQVYLANESFKDVGYINDLELSRLVVELGKNEYLGFLNELPSFSLEQLLLLKDRFVDSEWCSIINHAICLKQTYDVIVVDAPDINASNFSSNLKPLKNQLDSICGTLSFNLQNAYREKCLISVKEGGFCSILTSDSWLLNNRYGYMRNELSHNNIVECIAHIESGVMLGKPSQTATTFRKISSPHFKGRYFYHSKKDAQQSDNLLDMRPSLEQGNAYLDRSLSQFAVIEGSPYAYWVSNSILQLFSSSMQLKEVAQFSDENNTVNKEKNIRYWFEVSVADTFIKKVNFAQWNLFVSANNTGRWYESGNWVVNSKANVSRITSEACTVRADGGAAAIVLPNSSYVKSSYCFSEGSFLRFYLLGLINSKPFKALTSLYLGPKQMGKITEKQLLKLPIKITTNVDAVEKVVKELIDLHKKESGLLETSWEFKSLPIELSSEIALSDSYRRLYKEQEEHSNKVVQLESSLNNLMMDIYGLDSSDIILDGKTEIPLHGSSYCMAQSIDSNNIYQEYNAIVVKQFMSYAIGCMMGRFSLESEGVVVSRTDENENIKFTFDDNGIIPLTQHEWFEDDVTKRFIEFVKVTLGESLLHTNLSFIADSLRFKSVLSESDESNTSIIRYYINDMFYKDHLKAYKNTPIYWLFSSGRKKGFECLVYLHRYDENTLAKIRTEYVTPLIEKYKSYAEQLPILIENASTISESTKLQSERLLLKGKQEELFLFDRKLKEYADKRIKLDLDDGVQCNYKKFGNLLANAKLVLGKG